MTLRKSSLVTKQMREMRIIHATPWHRPRTGASTMTTIRRKAIKSSALTRRSRPNDNRKKRSNKSKHLKNMIKKIVYVQNPFHIDQLFFFCRQLIKKSQKTLEPVAKSTQVSTLKNMQASIQFSVFNFNIICFL